jgi:tetratricopeptide (TPR) repeat protein
VIQPGTGVRVAALLVALLAGCGSLDRRLEEANTQRHAGKPKEARDAYRKLLAEMGDGPLPDGEARVRSKALKYAAEISYLELGDYPSAVAYYRRIVSLQPATPEAFEARGAIGDIYRERFNDPLTAISQYADIASRDTPGAAQAQLKIARAWLELKKFEQARTEARTVRERWPSSPEADEAWALEGKGEQALGSYRALVERQPRQELVARALEGQALLYAQESRFDRALELYAQALPIHPNAESIRTNIEAVRRRRDAAKTAMPGDKAAAFDYGTPRPNAQEPRP